MTSREHRKKRDFKTGAGAAGVSGGTLLVLIAKNLPETSNLKPWLLLLAPSLSILLSAIWLWLQAAITNYFHDREVLELMNNAKSALNMGLHNPDTSDQHRAKLREKLEQLEMMQVGRYLDRINAATVITGAPKARD